jgi:hypothetical protein
VGIEQADRGAYHLRPGRRRCLARAGIDPPLPPCTRGADEAVRRVAKAQERCYVICNLLYTHHPCENINWTEGRNKKKIKTVQYPHVQFPVLRNKRRFEVEWGGWYEVTLVRRHTVSL